MGGISGWVAAVSTLGSNNLLVINAPGISALIMNADRGFVPNASVITVKTVLVLEQLRQRSVMRGTRIVNGNIWYAQHAKTCLNAKAAEGECVVIAWVLVLAVTNGYAIVVAPVGHARKGTVKTSFALNVMRAKHIT